MLLNMWQLKCHSNCERHSTYERVPPTTTTTERGAKRGRLMFN